MLGKTLLGPLLAGPREIFGAKTSRRVHRNGMSLALTTASEGVVLMLLSRLRPAVPATLVALVGFILLGGGCNNSSSTTSPTAPCTPTPTNPECVNPPNLLTVTIAGGVYSPNPVIVKVGQSVNWLNRDTIAHTATDPGVFDT